MSTADILIEPILMLLIPAALLLGAFFLMLFIYFNNQGHWDDLDSPASEPLKDSLKKPEVK